MVELKGEVVFTSIGIGLSGANVFTAAGALPASYQPTIRKVTVWAAIHGGTGTPALVAGNTPYIQVNTNGSLQLNGVSSGAAAGNTAFFQFAGRYDLTNP
jgi:hypothetical protein